MREQQIGREMRAHERGMQECRSINVLEHNPGERGRA